MLVLTYTNAKRHRGRFLVVRHDGAWILASAWNSEADAMIAARYLRAEFMQEARVALRSHCEIVSEAPR